MNDDRAEVPWLQLRAKLKARWVKLTEDDLQVPADGCADYLADKLQEHYGIARDEAKRQINTFDAGNAYPFEPVSRLPRLNTLRGCRSSAQR